MKAFHTIAVPHKDIIERRMDMDVFAANLWNTFRNEGSEEYTDAKTFFKKTHTTKSLHDLLEDIRIMLLENRGDSFQQVWTPFGGGKTHAMIALYHKCEEWGVKPVVIVGTTMSGEDTLWGTIEKQLDDRIDKMTGNLAPGREKIRSVLQGRGPVLILIDELVSYTTVAKGVRVVDTTLAEMTVNFIQQLSEEVATLPNVCVVASFPASAMEVSGSAEGEEQLNALSKAAGRVEKRVTPVDQDDVPNIIRSRLFDTPEDEIVKNARGIIDEFVDYCEKESILPPGMSPKKYREEFEKTYPFIPEVIEVLYEKWGSYNSFQRTRGVLRLLSLVVHSLKNSERPFITLADFDFGNNEIRRELLVHIGDHLESVIRNDITGTDSGARRSNDEAAPMYKGMRLGTKAATTIFMMSFSSNGVNGATMGEIKRNISDPGMTSAVVDGVVGNFRNKMSYVKSKEDRHFFSGEPNINRLKLDKMESIRDEEVVENERHVLEKNVSGKSLETLLWPESSGDVDDSPHLKLVVLQEDDQKKCEDILENKGNNPRIHRNSILFLCPSTNERSPFVVAIKEKIALENIQTDTPNLKPEQKKEIEEELRRGRQNLDHLIRKYYRTVYVPINRGIEKYDMGIPATGITNGVSEMVFERMRSENQVHEKIGSIILNDIHLKSHDYARTSKMYESMLRTRGDRRPVSREVVENSIIEGVRDGTFGIGVLQDGKPVFNHFKENIHSVGFLDDEVIIKGSLYESKQTRENSTIDITPKEEEYVKTDEGQTNTERPGGSIKELDFGFKVPEGKMSGITSILMLVAEKFNSTEIRIRSKDGSMTETDKKHIEEALDQMETSSDL